MAEQEEEPRLITIYGLKSHYGSIRAKICAGFLHRSLPHLYSKPKVFLLHDLDFKRELERLRKEAEKINRRIWSIKYPVLVFFRNIYIGDHRALIKYAIREHKIIPDFPSLTLFPDFKKLIPQKINKDYACLDVKIGNIIGKMFFELDTSICPSTCKFFKSFCNAKPVTKWGATEARVTESYIGTTFRRIYGKSLVQGGKIEGSTTTLDPENYTIKHDQRGILSFANTKDGYSTSEFCISFKENSWMDGMNVAFGRLIFGEHVLAAIEKVPTYYQSPLINITIVGAGVMFHPSEEKFSELEKYVNKEKERLNIQFTELERKRIEDIKKLKSIVKNFVSSARRDEVIEYECHLCEPQKEEKWSEEEFESEGMNLQSMFPIPRFEGEAGSEIMEEIKQPEWIQKADRHEEELIGEQVIKGWMISESQISDEIEYEIKEKKIEKGKIRKQKKILKEQFTLEELMEKARAEDKKLKKQFIVSIIMSILRRIMSDVPSRNKEAEYDLDELDMRDVPSAPIDKSRFQEGLYSLPNEIQYELIKTFEKMTPENFAKLHYAVKEMLEESGASEVEVEKIMEEVGSEGVISGVLLAIWDTAIEADIEHLEELTEEVINDFISAMKSFYSGEYHDRVHISKVSMALLRKPLKSIKELRKDTRPTGSVSSIIQKRRDVIEFGEEQSQTSRVEILSFEDLLLGEDNLAEL